MSRNKLEEFLTGPPFQVELHDRDRRADIIKPLPKIFDIHGNEEHLFDTSGKFNWRKSFTTYNFTQSAINGRWCKMHKQCTIHRTLHKFYNSGKSKALGPPGIPWDSYGIAKFDLSPLLLGEDKLRLKSLVLPCVRPVNSSRNSVLKTQPRLDDTGSLPCGRFIYCYVFSVVLFTERHILPNVTS